MSLIVENQVIPEECNRGHKVAVPKATPPLISPWKQWLEETGGREEGNEENVDQSETRKREIKVGRSKRKMNVLVERFKYAHVVRL